MVGGGEQGARTKSRRSRKSGDLSCLSVCLHGLRRHKKALSCGFLDLSCVKAQPAGIQATRTRDSRQCRGGLRMVAQKKKCWN